MSAATDTRPNRLEHETYNDVYAATHQWALDHLNDSEYPNRVSFANYQAMWGAAEQMGADGRYTPCERFRGQVNRALSSLVEHGFLVKVGKGQRDPAGHYTGNQPRFYTPESFARHVECAEQEAEAEDAEQARWERVSAILTEQGFEHTPGSVGQGSVLLAASLEAWEALADRLAGV